MKIMPCPLNGPRNIQEFICAGPVEPHPDPNRCSDEEWTEYVWLEENLAGVVREWWCHVATSYWFIAERDTVADEILATYPADRVFSERVTFEPLEPPPAPPPAPAETKPEPPKETAPPPEPEAPPPPVEAAPLEAAQDAPVEAPAKPQIEAKSEPAEAVSETLESSEEAAPADDSAAAEAPADDAPTEAASADDTPADDSSPCEPKDPAA